ncbi:major facilitator superfamily domain-containing protein [Xylariomycetidae sp. FL2044]|nr:major facilitator superfamily domain-containing protein [Xylariomycetidae sp. FL2044]
MADKKVNNTHVEDVALDVESSKDGAFLEDQVAVMGTVKLTQGKIIYIPTPTADPQDPLNMSIWQKYVVIIVISIFSTLGLSLVSGFGGLLGFYIPEYSQVGKDYDDITHLMTYPTLFMGIGNLIGMPFAYAVGRRMVLLGSTIIMIVATILCATAKDYEWHLAARMILGLAAGQSEALVPLITQEVFFLHERSRGLMIQQTVQVILTAIWQLFASPIAGAITPQGWYWLGAGLSGLQFIVTIFFVPETKYERSLCSFQESAGGDAVDGSEVVAARVCTERPPLDCVNFAPRTLRSDMRLWVGSPDWKLGWDTFVQTFELVLFPNVFWAMALNGLTIGVNIAIGTTYGSIVTGAPYHWPQTSASYVNCGQIVTALVALPFFGHGSDRLIRWFADRRGGIHEPEIRIIPLCLPVAVGAFTAVLYGLGAQHPHSYHWFTYVWAVAAYYFAFVGANIVAITYLLDSYPARAGPLLIIICAFRGIISFGVSYGITPFIARSGYDGAFGTFGGLTAALGLLGIPVYVWGKQIRHFTGRFSKDKQE